MQQQTCTASHMQRSKNPAQSLLQTSAQGLYNSLDQGFSRTSAPRCVQQLCTRMSAVCRKTVQKISTQGLCRGLRLVSPPRLVRLQRSVSASVQKLRLGRGLLPTGFGAIIPSAQRRQYYSLPECQVTTGSGLWPSGLRTSRRWCVVICRSVRGASSMPPREPSRLRSCSEPSPLCADSLW